MSIYSLGWERFIPNVGTFHSQRGNKRYVIVVSFFRIIIWQNEELCVPLPSYNKSSIFIWKNSLNGIPSVPMTNARLG